MKNYICIDGKKAELTEEQLKALGIETSKASPFDRVDYQEYYFRINGYGHIETNKQINRVSNDFDYAVANYCTDKSIMEQRALHETLNRLLWRYSMTHDGDKIDLEKEAQKKWIIVCDHKYNKIFCTPYIFTTFFGSPIFYTKEIAEQAIKKIIEPFMKEHPEFKW